MQALRLLAFDLGASNGRGILGHFDGKTLQMEELHRFENCYVDKNGLLFWDIDMLFGALKDSFAKYAGRGEAPLSSFGIDSWGVDYGLLDAAGALIEAPRCYRNGTDADMERVFAQIDKRELFMRTGIAALNFNTIYQLCRRKAENDPALARADCMLMIPDLLAYLLTGEKASEYTNATTTQLYAPAKHNWDFELIERLGLPRHIFQTIQPAGTLRGALSQAVQAETGLGAVPFAAIGSHDTASAVCAIPGRGNFAFCSSGTWSLFGVETDEPLLSDYVYEAGFSNEGTVQGGFRPLKNIMGLWIVQECRRDWIKEGLQLSWNDIVAQAQRAPALRSVIDPDYGPFFSVGNMREKIQDYCRRTKQPVPESVGEIARCIYESLALKYRWALDRLAEIKGAKIDMLNIVGGGCQNKMLNQMAADAAGIPVTAGPQEGAAIGSLLMQAMALGEISSMDELRQVVRDSFDVEEYLPRHSQAWEDAYGKLLDCMDTCK